MVLDVLLDTLLDALKMAPILYLAYLLMEVLEHHAGEKMNQAIAKVGKAGPLLGAALGVVPQCGFSGAIAGFYAGGVATLGTLIAVFMSTSDEMLPLMISEGAQAGVLFKLLLAKFAAGLVFGYLVDFVFHGHTEMHIEEICEQDHCDCESHNVWASAGIHCLKVMGVILIVTFLLNLAFELGGADFFSRLLPDVPVLSELIAALIGLVPSCSASVLLTELYLNDVIHAGALIAGLSANAGVGLVVLFRQHRHMFGNFKITGLLYVCSVVAGVLLGLMF
ncbi:MAG: arsenic efflux protein [Firmicutes bacterium]|nr:arsenic efflux protein [Bacillota bacterium]